MGGCGGCGGSSGVGLSKPSSQTIHPQMALNSLFTHLLVALETLVSAI
jgi:hypothetical protein